MRPRLRLAFARVALCAALFALAPTAAPAAEATLGGSVRVDVPGVPLANLLPIVAYLAPLDGSQIAGAGLPARHIRQKDARFLPGFLTVAVGQRVEMPNDDVIFHNVFSFSRPNEFDLGFYEAGQSKSIAFEHAGVVRIYCSIHENMSGTIFVSPSPHVAAVDPAGRFEIRGVPAGRWRLETWSEKLPRTSREISVSGGRNDLPPIALVESVD